MNTAPLDHFAPHPLLDVSPTIPESVALLAKERDYKESAADRARDFNSMRKDYAERGILQPVDVVRRPKGWRGAKAVRFLIVDGRHRWEGAKAAGVAEIHYNEIPESDVIPTILGSVAGRVHTSKSFRAFTAILQFPELIEEGAKGRGKKTRTECGFSREELAEQIGVSNRTIEQAQQLARLLAGEKDLIRECSAKLMLGASLAGLLSGLTNRRDPERKKFGAGPTSDSYARALSAWGNNLNALEKWEGLERSAAEVNLRNSVKKLNATAREALRVALDRADEAEEELECEEGEV